MEEESKTSTIDFSESQIYQGEDEIINNFNELEIYKNYEQERDEVNRQIEELKRMKKDNDPLLFKIY